jgi:hypothetical protein
VLDHIIAKAKDHEARGKQLQAEALKELEEAKSFFQLASQMAAKFPGSLPSEESKGPMLTNMPMVTFEAVQEHLSGKAGRVKHVASRLGASEQLVRDLINAPNSKFYIAERGWIKPKGTASA